MPNIALYKNASASSYVAPFSPSRAVNGQITPLQRWACDVLPAELVVDLGEYYRINSVVLKFLELAGWPSSYNLKGFFVSGSTDNIQWNNWGSSSGNTASSYTVSVSNLPARYVKMTVNPGWGLGNNLNAASLLEMEVYESPIDAFLSNLTISSGTLSPVFNKKTFTYITEVGSGITSVTVTPTADDPIHASIKVNNQTVNSGSPSQSIQLSPGLNTITVAVINQGIQETYTIRVSKLSATVAYLSALTVKDPRNNTVALTPVFAPTTLSYSGTANVASVTVTPVSDGNQITVNDASVPSGSPSSPITLIIGANSIMVKVTPGAGGSTTTYTITLTRS